MKMIRQDPNLPASMTPPVTHCLFHRCARHEAVPQLNAACPDDSECGGCLGEEVWGLERHAFWPVLDVLASYLRQSSIVKMQLQRCVDRLNELQPGAGDALLTELVEQYRDLMFQSIGKREEQQDVDTVGESGAER